MTMPYYVGPKLNPELLSQAETPTPVDACEKCGVVKWRLFEQGPGLISDWFKFRCENEVFEPDDLDLQFPETCAGVTTIWNQK